VANPDLGHTDSTTGTSGNVIIGADPAQADNDVDSDALTVIQVNGDGGKVGQPVAGSTGGLFVLNPDGSYSFDPHHDFDGLKQGQAATTQITYTISDGRAGTSTTTLTITIDGVNDAPKASQIPDQADLDAKTGIALDISHTFTDPEGDALTYQATGLPPGLIIDPATGLITGTIDRSASQGSPDGSYRVTVTATDEDGASIAQTFVWRIANPVPNAVNDAGTTPNDVPLQGNVLGNDHDPDGDRLTVHGYTVAGLNGAFAAGDSVVIADVGTITLNADGSYVFVAADRYFGNVPVVTYQIVDGEGGSASAELRIGVTAANHVQPLPPNWHPLTGTPLGATLEQTATQRIYGQIGLDRDTDEDAIDDGGVLPIDYWALHPDVYRIARGAYPALFVTHEVRTSQEMAWWPEEPAIIKSEIIANRLEMSYDLHVVKAVEASQRIAGAVDRQVDGVRYETSPGENELFNDFDTLARLTRGVGPDVLHGRPDAAPARSGHAPSFTEQLHKAAGASRAPAQRTTAPVPTVKP
jgi:VCBS repeat-containing protein